MKVGMIFECTEIGADGKVYPYLAKLLRPDIEIDAFYLGAKSTLFEKCGTVAKDLIEKRGCEKVVIIWDLRPPWSPTMRCPAQECLYIQAALDRTQLTSQQRNKIHLICIVHELEAFFLADNRKVQFYLENFTRRTCKVPAVRNPEREPLAKERLEKIFEQNGCRKYNDLKDAEKLVRVIDIDKLQKSNVFARFERTILSL